ncbi:MAG: RNA polymerase sigma factor [Mariniblastus sp.]
MNQPPPTNEKKSQSGQALELLFRDARGELLGTLFYLIGNMEDAKDALQETFLKCWRKQDQVDSIENLKAWVFRIALNTGRDIRKTAWKRRRESLAEDAIMVSTSDSPEMDLVQREQVQQLRQAVMRLRPKEQEVFLLRQNGNLTYEQIAKATGMPLGTVKTRMRAAISQLRESVGGQS